MNIFCPYCKEKLFPSKSGKEYFFCDKHVKSVMIKADLKEIFYISIFSKSIDSYIIDIYKDKMKIYEFNLIKQNIILLPFDKSLTPENFEQKLKTYFTFQ